MTEQKRVPKEEIEQRIQRLQASMQQQKVDIALITHYVDLYYFSGTLQNGWMVIPQVGSPCFYVKKSLKRAEEESHVPVEPLGRTKEMKYRLQSRYGSVATIGMELDVLPYQWVQRHLQLWDQAKLVDLSYTVRYIRSIKTNYEIQQIRQAAEHVDQVVRSLRSWIHRGMTELQLAAEIEHVLRLRGNSNLYRVRGYNQELFLGMVTSGRAAAIPTFFDGPAGGLGVSIANPQSASNKPFQRGEPILVDIGTVCEGYLVDQTRMAVIGELPHDLSRAYELARSILRMVEPLGRPGVSWEHLYQVALEKVKEEGLGEHFMGYGEDQAKFLGHGVGLEIDEFPILANRFQEPLQKGMVIAIEPKFTFPEKGVVGIENTYVVTEDGLESLTISSEEMIDCG